jgi:predicted RNase H-like HicB family nuclease
MFLGPPITDEEILELLPDLYRELLGRANGYVAYHGGLHVRGACLEPRWHSLRDAWFGDEAIHRLYPAVGEDDVPFAEDALGDQFLIRDGVVYRLLAETGEMECLGMDLHAFDQAARADPAEFLALAPLDRFRAAGGVLLPGQLLNVYPPFVAQAEGIDPSYRAIDSLERRRWLAALAGQLRDVPDGTRVRFVPGEP